MTSKKLSVLIIAILALALVAALRGRVRRRATTATTTTAATAARPAGDDIVIGAINSISGVNALTGAEHKWAQEKAAADWNAKGGIKLADGKMHKIVLKYVDDKSSDTEAAAAMEKLIKTDGLKVILSSNTTPYNQAAATVAEQYGAYYHICTSWIATSSAA